MKNEEKRDYNYKPVEKLTFTDDFMFGAVMKHKEICIGVLERLLHIKIDHIEYPKLQKHLKPFYTSKGVRLDVYVKDSDRVFDVELQNRKFEALGKRTRYYQSMIDMDNLVKGEDYSTLKESYVIFICTDDPFGKGLAQYSFKDVCLENTEVELDDKVHKLIYNSSSYKVAKDTDPKLYNFLRFVNDNSADDDFTDEISRLVEKIKANDKFKTEYMAVNLHERDIRVEAERNGIAKGEQKKAIETARKMLAAGLAVEQISLFVDLPAEEIKKLQKD